MVILKRVHDPRRPENLMLQQLYEIPAGLLDRSAPELHAALGGPTLIHLPGEREAPLFVSILMHGNETVGWEALRSLLKRYAHPDGGFRLPRALSLFIGNLEAAACSQRHLPGQPDFNRVWPGSELPPTPEHRLMEEVVRVMSRRGIFASVDIHNNTGFNPHYACVNRLDNRFLHLATLFSRTVVYFLRPKGVQSMAMAALAPAVTLECGKVGERHGVEHATEYLDACLRIAALPDHPVAPHDVDLFHTVAQVKVPPEVSFGFEPAEGEHDILFAPDLDRLNFRELPRGALLGRVTRGTDVPVEARDERGRDVTEHYFEVTDQQMQLRVAAMPSMLTRDLNVIRQDCLCYLMERYNDHVPRND